MKLLYFLIALIILCIISCSKENGCYECTASNQTVEVCGDSAQYTQLHDSEGNVMQTICKLK